MKRSARPSTRDELRSYFVPLHKDQLPSSTDPCTAPDDHDWVHAFGPDANTSTPYVGKWLIYLKCSYTASCWEKVRAATEAGLLGVGAKVSTHGHMADDPVGSWADHVVCVYTADFRDEADVLRVAKGLKAADAVRTLTLHYKPDGVTLAGRYAGNAAGEIAIYSCHPPDYDQLSISDSNVAMALRIMQPTPTKVYHRRPRCPGSLQKPSSIKDNSGHPLGTCPACGETFALRTDGAVWHHTSGA
ncbi:MAG: DUF1917 domain-containing protein [Chloroflexi bacterium]|nr:DUF1917 domain-containing protein [Chloroflexota bacterium]